MDPRFRSSLNFPSPEQLCLDEMETLFREWHQHFAAALDSPLRELSNDMVFDGFYPHYFEQPFRLLFIGLESRQIAGNNYLDLLHAAYSCGKDIGGVHLDNSRFHYRMLRTAHGILRGMPAWAELPLASQIGDSFGRKDGISFAFMNLSKLSNEEESHSADWSTIHEFHALSTRGQSFYMRQIALLQPQIVITMNIQSYLDSFGSCTYLDRERGVTFWELDTSGNRALLIDAFHFSAWNKDDQDDYYVPICNGVVRHSRLFDHS